MASSVAEAEKFDIDMLSLVLVDNATIIELNRDLRDTESPTDVIAFEAETGPDGQTEAEAYISVQQAVAQAAQHGHTVQWELAFLVAHAVLHAGGYSDHDPQAREAMLARQTGILTELKGRIGIARQ